MYIKFDFSNKSAEECTELLYDHICEADDVINVKKNDLNRYVIVSPDLMVLVQAHSTFERCEFGKPFNNNPENKWVDFIGTVMAQGPVDVYVDGRLPGNKYFMKGVLWSVTGFKDTEHTWYVGSRNNGDGYNRLDPGA